jgi:outer membrane protein assembly factor BamB/tetratricopeptide (TPR) repeat protein
MLTILLLSGVMTATSAGAAETPSVVLSGESRATALRLAEAQKRLDEHHWPEAIEELQAILNSAGDDLVPLSPTHSVQARRVCQVRLAALPPEALRTYRRRYETQARRKLEQAQESHDFQPLRRVVDEAFCTRAAEKAIDQLGDLAFERGRFDEAEEWWRLLSPLPDARRDEATRGFALVYPDLSLDPARLQAKQLLARLFANPGRSWTAALEQFRARHSQAEGALAGRKGRYADLLQTLAQERRKAGPLAAPGWPTFGGDDTRGRVLPAPDDVLDHLSALCRAGPTWRFNLEARAQLEGPIPPPAVNGTQARALAFHPVIVGHQVLVADAQSVTAYDLRSGKSSEWYDAAEVNGGVKPNLTLPAPPDLRYTLTVADENVYVRLGAQDLGMETPPKPAFGQIPRAGREKETFLACLSLRPDGQDNHLRWSLRGIAHDNAIYEGSPLVADGQIVIASLRYVGDRCISAIDAYPVDETSEPSLRWRRELCETRETRPGEPRFRHHLLTRAGTQLVFCSHTGAIVAVDALTGRTSWAIRYPRRAPAKEATLPLEEVPWPGLAPVLYAEGRLYIAPVDSDHLLCLDPASGRTLWEREAMKVVHLLGVGRERLIFSTAEGLRAVGAADGGDVSGWMIPHAGGPRPPMGRGLLIGDLVLWPTLRPGDLSVPSGVEVIRQRDGRPADDPSLLHRLPAGNLAYANGCLAVADRRTLTVFVPPRMLLRERKAEAERHPNSAPALLELGRAEADAGLTQQAIQTFLRAEERASRGTTAFYRRQLVEQSRDARQHALLEAGRRAGKRKQWEEAASALQQAAEVPLPPPARLHALTRAAQSWQDAEQLARALAAWETILADPTLRHLQVLDTTGTPVSAGHAAATEIARLSNKHSPVHPRSPPPVAVDSPIAIPLPLVRAWHVLLDADERLLTDWQKVDPDVLLTDSSTGEGGGCLRCRTTRDGAICWESHLPFVPSWAGCHADTILAGGERGVACLRREDGQRLWYFPAPALARYPAASAAGLRVVQDPRPPEPLTEFRLIARRLYFLQGQRRLFALRAETGEVLWDRWAPDGRFHLPSPQGCFSPCYHAGAKTILVQAAGRRWTLDAPTGRTIQETSDSQGLWQRPPLELDAQTLCVVPDNRHVRLLDAATGKVRWTHPLTGGTTRSGELPHVLGRDEVLLLAIPANVGYYVQRLDRATGQPLWPRPCLLMKRAWDESGWSFDKDAVYLVTDRMLIARSLADGRLLWERPLDAAGSWQAQRVGDHLAVYPSGSSAQRCLRFRSPLGSVQWNLGPALRPEAVFAVQSLDPRTGQLLQRLNFRVEAPARTTLERRRFPGESGRYLFVQTSGWLASRSGPAIRFDSPRPFAAVGGDVWGLSAILSESSSAASGSRSPK